MGGCDGSGLGSWVVMAVLLCLTREGMTTRRSGFVGGKKLPSETVGAAMLGKREGGQPCGLGQYGRIRFGRLAGFLWFFYWSFDAHGIANDVEHSSAAGPCPN